MSTIAGNGKNGVYEYSKEKIEENFLKIHTYEAWIIKQENNDDEEEKTQTDNSVVSESNDLQVDTIKSESTSEEL